MYGGTSRTGWFGPNRSPVNGLRRGLPAGWPAQKPFYGGVLWQFRLRTPVVGATPGTGPEVRTEAMAQTEAVLLLAREPLGSRKLAQLAGLADGTEARTLVRKINRLYDVEGCAFRIVEVAGGFQLMTRPKFAPWLRRLHGSQVEVRLSAPAVETLAVVAYRQPVLRADIEAVRGVQCGEILRQLMERDLVRIVGRSEELGRPLLYGTTKRFLQVFGLRHLEELPRTELSQPAPAADQPVAAASVQQDDSQRIQPNQPVSFNKSEGNSDVKTAIRTGVASAEILEEEITLPVGKMVAPQAKAKDDDFEEEDEEFEDDDDFEDDDEDADDDDAEEDLDEDEEEWEEVDDEEEEEEDDEDLDEDEDWEDEEEWDEDEEEDDDDWDEDDEEEEEDDEDWE
jgi:segregation and condensation protein B